MYSFLEVVSIRELPLKIGFSRDELLYSYNLYCIKLETPNNVHDLHGWHKQGWITLKPKLIGGASKLDNIAYKK